jgi:hypothetical protein
MNRQRYESGKILTVKTQTMTMPMKTAKKIQPDHAVALNPVYIFATITAEIAIVYIMVSFSRIQKNRDIAYSRKLHLVNVKSISSGTNGSIGVESQEEY